MRTMSPPAPALSAAIGRNGFFAGLFLLAVANGLAAKAADAVHRLGWTDAVLGSFDVSAIVLIACAAGLWLVWHSRSEAVAAVDLVAGLGAVALIAVPIGGLSWVAIDGLAVYALWRAGGDPGLRRGAMVLFAVTVPMLWSSLLFQFFANVILQADAALVAWLVGTARSGNMVRFVSGEGNLVIFPACSSLANMSLAVLSWVVISEWVGHRRSLWDVLWTGLACGSVVAINVARMALMAVDLRVFELVHSDLGDAVAATMIFAAIVGWSLVGVRREISFRR
jgi:hypothetical protein